MTVAIIVAAGAGRRMGGDVPKQYRSLGEDPVVGRTLRVFDACGLVDDLVWVAPDADLAYCRTQILERLGLKKKVLVTAGGSRRQASVYRGLLASATLLGSPMDLVAIHDGVRPLVTLEQVSACILRARETGACILGVPVFDTLKKADPNGSIAATKSREGMWLAQTPQVFRHDLILRAHEEALACGFTGTDDGELVERLGAPVAIVCGSRYNIKVTTAEDLALARVLIR